jgi:hypothetical protein
MSGYVYFVHLNPLEKDGLDARIKIGMSSKKNNSRMEAYPKQSNLLRKIICSNYNDVENALIVAFTRNFDCYQGAEFYMGELEALLACFDAVIDEIELDIHEMKIDIKSLVVQYSNNLDASILIGTMPTQDEAFKAISNSLQEQTSSVVVTTIDYIRHLNSMEHVGEFVIPFEKLYEAGVIQQSKKKSCPQPSKLLIKNREMTEGVDYAILKVKRNGGTGGKPRNQYMLNIHSFLKVLTMSTGNGIVPSDVYCDYLILNNTLQTLFINACIKSLNKKILE